MKNGIAIAGLALVALLALSPSHAAAAEGPIGGRWAIETSEEPGTVRLTIRREADDVSGQTAAATVDVSSLRGLDLSGAGEEGGRVRFQLARDAGTLECEGSVEEGRGEGTFVFAPNRELAGELRRAGYKKPFSDAKLFALAAHDIGAGYLSELGELGYARVSVEKLLEMAAQDVTPDFIRGFADAGYKRVAPDTLVALRMNGVTPEFAAEMNALGERRLSIEELIALRVHGVSPELTDELKDLGYASVDPGDLLAMRQHGVSPDFIRAVQAEGYQHVDADQLVEMAAHGVSPEYIRKMKSRFGDGISIAEMLRMRKAGEDE